MLISLLYGKKTKSLLAEHGHVSLLSAAFVMGLHNLKYNAERSKTNARVEKLVIY